jgi:MFS family permease
LPGRRQRTGDREHAAGTAVPKRGAGRVLPRGWAFAGMAYMFGITMLGTTLPTPLYPSYEQEYGFASLTTTAIYGVYAAGVLAVLLLAGSASDVVGRRPALAAGLAASIVSAIVFATSTNVPALFLGRVLSGLSAGVFTGTATVTLVELAPEIRHRAAGILASAVNMLGLGCGALLTGIVASVLPAPLRTPYLVNLALIIPAALALVFMPETVEKRSLRLPRPRMPGVPKQARAVFLPAAVVAFAAFAVFGLVTAIAPAFLATLLHLPSPLLSGALVFAMFAGSAAGQATISPYVRRIALPLGCVILLAGLAAITLALAVTSLWILVVGTILAGIGQGVTFSAGIVAISAASPADRRAETVSAFFVIAYAAISLPVLLVGAAVGSWGLRLSGIVFTSACGALTLAALVAVLRLLRSRRPS